MYKMKKCNMKKVQFEESVASKQYNVAEGSMEKLFKNNELQCTNR